MFGVFEFYYIIFEEQKAIIFILQRESVNLFFPL